MEPAPAVELKGLVKQFGTVLANDHVDFSVRKGEIHALLGENGAGKSTVMCMLSGVYRLAQSVGLPFAAARPVWQLSVGEQQRVEIVKTLYRGAELIILDEPTSVLTPGEADQLFATLQQLKSQGKTVILTTHKLKEVMAVADRISVMRKGKMLATLDKSGTDERAVARLMVGQDRQEPRPRSRRDRGAPVLTLDRLTVTADHGRHALDAVSFAVHEGEIVGIAGVAGNGQKELAEVLAGLRSWSAGTLSFRDVTWKSASVRHSITSGIAHIPENRMKSGLAGSLGSVDNLLVKSYRTKQRSRWGFLRTAINRLWSQKLVEQFDVKTAHLDAPVHQMSGGNQQKLLFAREIHQQPHLMVAVHPTQGLDVGATDGVHNLLMNLRDEGRSVLLISEDLDELLLLSDRIIVLFAGKVMGEVAHEQADREHLGLWMAGVAGEAL
jgi:simple sugar transport system ATP-binding protein